LDAAARRFVAPDCYDPADGPAGPEALWAAVAAAAGYTTLKDWPPDWQLLGLVTVAARAVPRRDRRAIAPARPRLCRPRSPLTGAAFRRTPPVVGGRP